MTKNDLTELVVHGLREAEGICIRNGVRLTKLRHAILELLLTAGRPIKAYDIIEQMREKGERLTPATVYRIMDFLLQYGLVHRVNSLNAFVSCTGNHAAKHTALMFVCSECKQTEELEDQHLYEAMRAKLGALGLSLSDNCIEVQGTCRSCTPVHSKPNI
jgi:Fur family zinc uptake transcriptional regulator